MDLGHSNLNPSSLLALKAELHKKYENLRKSKLSQTEVLKKPSPFRSKNDPPKEKKKELVAAPKVIEDDEEDLKLKKSRLALEAKSKLYDKIVSSDVFLDDEQNESYLVDFQRKVLYNPTETLPFKELYDDKSKDSTSTVTSLTYTNKEAAPLPYEDGTATKDPADEATHYQNVRFNEVRDHGTGYFAFSTDEATRKEEMDELRLLRQKTEEQRLSKQRLLKKRQAMLQTRLARICERKNIDQSVLETYKTETDDDKMGVPETKETDLSSIPLPEEETENITKKPKIRPWDIGKDGLQHFVPEEKKTKTQNDWVKEKREERVSEFAPPSQYLYR